MSSEIIYWLIPGYFCLLIYNGTLGIRHQGTWDFLVKLAPASAVCSILAQLVIYYFYLDQPTLSRLGVATEVLGQKEIQLILGLVIAIPVGLGSPWIISTLFYIVNKIRPIHNSPAPTTDNPHLFSARCKKYLGKMVQVSLKNNKVYGAYLLAYSFDDAVPGIVVNPFISGYRNQDMTVTFNTAYLMQGEKLASLKNRELLIPVTEISTIAEMDIDFHLYMLRTGTLKWSPRPQPPSVQTQKPPS